MAKNKSRTTKIFRDKLMLLSPPDQILADFDRLCEAHCSTESEDTLEELLMDSCRLLNWTDPWNPTDAHLSFKASLLDKSHPEYKPDYGGENTPSEEQSYRRGYTHGFAAAKRELSNFPKADEILKSAEKEIHRWRFAKLYDRTSIVWGAAREAVYECKVRAKSRRSTLSLRARFRVIERDQRRCKICGASANDGTQLEVDHIIPRAKGGTDEIENLQTLCFDCNRGKADT